MGSTKSILALVLVALLVAMGTSECESDSRKIVQASEILAKIERGEPLDDVIIEGDLDLSGRVLKTVHFNNTVFQGNVSFKGTNFTGDASFREANFSGYASFFGAEFSGGDAYFSGTVFSSGDTDFQYAVFSGGDAHFYGAVFSGGVARFSGAVFSGGDASFQGVEFSDGVAYFNGAVFSGGDTYFSYAVFSGGAVTFQYAEFSGGNAYFSSAEFSGGAVTFQGAVFSGGVAYFKYAVFSGGDTYFSYAVFSGGDVTFQGAVFSGGNANFEDTIFGNTNQSESFNVGLEYARFDYDAYFEKTTIHPNTKLDLTRSSYRRMFLPWSSINQNQASPSDDDAYLALMRNYINLGWYEDANLCYYEYRNKQRAAEPNVIEMVIDAIEWALYGYGMKPLRTLGWIVGLVFAFGLVYRNGQSIKKYTLEKSEVPLEDRSTTSDKCEVVRLETTLRRSEINLAPRCFMWVD